MTSRPMVTDQNIAPQKKDVLDPIWKKLRYHKVQQAYYNSVARFCISPAGRRAGKTELAKRRCIKRALKQREYADAWYIMAAPTHQQAKRIYWNDLKLMIPPSVMIGPPEEGPLTINLVNGSRITVLGLDAPERVEGPPLSGIVLDEYGNMKESVWQEHVRPSLSDRLGWADFIGVPEGRNHYYDLYLNAKADTTGEWNAFHWVSADILPAAEIASAKRGMDPLTFDQEYNASFVIFEGQAYYCFNSDIHCVKVRLYRPDLPLIFCFDFNVSPQVVVVCQEIDGMTCIVGEVYIPNNSNTPVVCNKLIQDWGEHKHDIFCYGDATGGARGTAQVHGSDWDLVVSTLRPHYKHLLKMRVDKANPRERVRLNAVNSRLKSADGTVKVKIDVGKAPMIVKDFEGVRLLKGGSGELDKKSDPKLTHSSDAFGYYIAKKHPVREQYKTRSQEVA